MTNTFSLRWIFAGTALVGLALVALLNAANNWLAAAVVTFLVGLLLITTLLGFAAARPSYFAKGFAIVAWTYFVLWWNEPFSIPTHFLLPEQFIVWACSLKLGVPNTAKDVYIASSAISLEWMINVFAVSHSLFTMLFGLLGGIACSRMWANDAKQNRGGPMASGAS